MQQLIRSVRIFDRPQDSSWDVLIEDGQIVNISEDIDQKLITSSCKITDYSGSYAEMWPSFVECHAHFALSPYLEGPPDDPWIIAYQYLLAGVTHIIDLFGFPEIENEWDKSEEISKINFPNVIHSGYALTSSPSKTYSGHGKEFPIPVFEINSKSEVDRAIDINRKLGAKFIKIMFTAGKEIPSSKRRFSILQSILLKHIAQRLSKLHIHGIVDVNSLKEAFIAKEMGFSIFAHPIRDCILSSGDWEKFKGCIFNSTLTGLRPMTMSWKEFCKTFNHDNFLESQSSRHLEFMKRRVVSYGTMIGIQNDRQKSIQNATVNAIEGIRREQTVIGTDAGNTFSFHGYGLKEEINTIWQSQRIEMRRILLASTNRGHQFFSMLSGADPIGIHVGSSADFNIFDPLLISTGNLNPIQTFVRGKEIHRKILIQILRNYFNSKKKGNIYDRQTLSA